MTPEKVRIKKYHHERIDQWCEALGIPSQRLVEDAINFYLQFLDGKSQSQVIPQASQPQTQPQPQPQPPQPQLPPIVEIEDLEDFTGDIEL